MVEGEEEESAAIFMLCILMNNKDWFDLKSYPNE